MLDLDLAVGVLVDGQRVDHADGVALAQPLELGDDLAVEVRVLEAEHDQLYGSDRHGAPLGRMGLTDPRGERLRVHHPNRTRRSEPTRGLHLGRCSGRPCAALRAARRGPRLRRRRLGRLRPDLPQRLQEGRRGVDEQQAAAADRPRREHLGPPEGREVGKQPVVGLLRQVPVAVDAAEQVRRDVVGAERRGQRLQVPGDHGQGRRDPPAGERDRLVGKAQKMFGTKWTSTTRPRATSRRAAGEHAEAAEGHQGQRRHGRRHARCRSSRHAARRARAAPRWSPTAARRPAPARRRSVRPDHVPSALASSEGPVPEPDPDRLRDRAAAGGRPAGQGARLAIVGEAPTPPPTSTSSATASATAGNVAEDPQRRRIQPILESSLDAMVVSMVAPAARPASTSGCTRSTRTPTTATSWAS